MIGYKMWATLLAQALVPAGILVIAADYRNYPFGTVPAMIQDVEDVLQWAFEHCDDYGGDPNQIILVGQSAGAHLGMMSVLRRRWNIKGFLGLSGVYDMREITRNFAKHGLSHDFVQQCLFQNRMDECDPTILISLEEKTMPLLPPIELWHGTGDKTVSHDTSKSHRTLLDEWGASMYSHTRLLTIRLLGRARESSHSNLNPTASRYISRPISTGRIRMPSLRPFLRATMPSIETFVPVFRNGA